MTCTDQRPHVRGEHAVGARHQHHFVFRCEARHHLDDARVAGSAQALEPLEQLHLPRVLEGSQGVDGPV
jgi:hypothetical protein